MDRLENIRVARSIIRLGAFTEDQVTTIYNWLGFSDTAFRDKKSQDKLDDHIARHIAKEKE